MKSGVITWLMAAPLMLSLATAITSSTAEAKAKKHGHHKAAQCCDPNECKGKGIASTVCADSSMKQLAAALKEAGLCKALNGKGPFTLFAPDDAAFAKLPKGNTLSSDKDKLTKVLKYHVINKKLASSDLGSVRSEPTLEGESVMINNKDGKIIVDGAIVTKADIPCGNGVIHVIDTVLMPERGK
jgi:uncharacterized surface protein with fasciclin (FAS1) repeats